MRASKSSARGRRLTGAQTVIAAAAVVAATLAGTVSAPVMLSSMRHADSTAAQARQVRQQASDTARVHAEPEAAARLAQLRRALPDTASLGPALVTLQDASRASGARWVASIQRASGTVSVETATGSRQVETYALTVTLEATPDQLAAFMTRVQGASRLMVVDAATVNGADATVALTVFALPTQDGDR